MEAVDYDGLRARAGGKARRPEAGELMGIGVAFFTEIVGAGPSQDLRHPRHRHVRQLRDPRPPDRQRDRAAGHHEPGPGPRDHLRADHRDRDRHPVRAESRSRRATPTPRPTASAPTARARRRWPAPPPRWPRARSAPRRRRSPPTCSRCAEDDLEWDIDRFKVKGLPEKVKTMKEIAWAAYHKVPRAWSRGSRRSTTTTRRT